MCVCVKRVSRDQAGRDGNKRGGVSILLYVNTQIDLPHTLDVAAPLLVSAVVASLDGHGVCVCVHM